jgi:arsenical pump membrane protein
MRPSDGIAHADAGPKGALGIVGGLPRMSVRGAPPSASAVTSPIGTSLEWSVGALGCAAALAAALWSPHHAAGAAVQDWPPFVLVAGLLLVGLVAHEDGLFDWTGTTLARLARRGWMLYVGTTVLVVVVTTLLNLDTAVTFLTPVVIYAARNGELEVPLVYACLLLSNAGSLLLPGSNLTNLIVLGHLHLSGGAFFSHMAPAGLAAAAVTSLVVGTLNRSRLRGVPGAAPERPKLVLGIGVVAVAAVTVFVLVLGPGPAAVAVVCTGVVAVVLRRRPARAVGVLSAPLLVGLFGIAVALGALGRAWSGPQTVLSHVGPWGAAAVGGLASLLVNNLPAASLLAARTPPHPFALLVGLNVGPNLFVTGSLAWVLWLKAAHAAGARPSVRRAALLGVASAPLAVAAAVGLLVATGTR